MRKIFLTLVFTTLFSFLCIAESYYVVEIETKTNKAGNACNPVLNDEVLSFIDFASYTYSTNKDICRIKLFIKSKNIDKLNTEISKLKIKKLREYLEPEPTPTRVIGEK